MKKNITKFFENSLDLKTLITFRQTNRRIIQKEQEILKKWNITLTQFGVLRILYHKGKTNVQYLIDNLFTTSGNMTLVINNMERDGLITKEKSERDKRLYLISLSEKGEDLLDKIFPEYSKIFSKLLSKFNDQEKNKFIELLKKLET